MIINTPISLGELVDKISILKIKQKKINDKKKSFFIKEELSLLQTILLNLALDKKIYVYLDKLTEINSKLWRIEDDIRDCERNKKFNQKFINLSRAVYKNNDKRSEIKLEINNHFGSTLVEIKSYEKY